MKTWIKEVLYDELIIGILFDRHVYNLHIADYNHIEVVLLLENNTPLTKVIEDMKEKREYHKNISMDEFRCIMKKGYEYVS